MDSKSRRKSVGTHVSDDLVIEILARLPTKSLRRFQCVSKAWATFASDVSSRRRLFRPMSGLFFYYQDLLHSQHPSPRDRGTYAPIPDGESCLAFESRLSRLPFYSKSAAIHSCNGLLLFATSETHRGGRCSYFVCNPATMEFVTLPRRRRMHRLCFLAFDPRESPHFKVVRFTYDDGLRAIVEVYSSMSRNWAEIFYDDRYSVSMYSWDFMSVFHKGSLCMLSIPEHLVSFDVEEGSFRVMSLPKVQRSVYAPACIGVSRGHLYYAVNVYTHFELRIWVLDEGSSVKWSLKHRMSTKVFDEHPPTRNFASSDPAFDIQPIAFNPDSEVIYLSLPRKIVAYHPSSGALEEICRVSRILKWTKVFTVVPCLESIDPPGGTFIRC